MRGLRTLAAAALALAASAAGANQTIDTSADWTGDQAFGWAATAQIFTVPSLDRVLQSWTFTAPDASATSLVFSIRALDGAGLPTGATLFSQTKTGADVAGVQSYVGLNLSLLAGKQYAAVVEFNGPLGPDLNIVGDVYSGGGSFWSSDVSDPTGWVSVPTVDHSFTAQFMPSSPVPEADGAAMLLAGGGALALFLRRRRAAISAA